MITKKIGWIGCGNMGGAILSGALESGGILCKQRPDFSQLIVPRPQRRIEIVNNPAHGVPPGRVTAYRRR